MSSMSNNQLQPDYVEPPPPTAPTIAPDAVVRRQLEIARAKLEIDKHVWKCCLNCDSWKAGCVRYTEQPIMPPPDVLIVGCEGYTSTIPF